MESPTSASENQKRKPFCDASKLSLGEWLKMALLHQDDRDCLIIDCCFPTVSHQSKYLRGIHRRSNREVKQLLRNFLIQSGSYGCDDRYLQYLRENPERLVKQVEQFEFVKRMLNPDRQPWEGITWTLDLLPDHPQEAIEVINAYSIAHCQLLPDARISGLYSATAIIRAKYLEVEHPQDALFSLGSRDFEFLVAALYAKMGCNVSVTKASRDGGYDVEAVFHETGQASLALIECKLHSNPIGEKEARSLNGVVEAKKANKGVLISASTFTEPARKFAKQSGRIELVDFPKLTKLLNRHFGAEWPLHIDFYISNQKTRPG
jgi:restriction system protein